MFDSTGAFIGVPLLPDHVIVDVAGKAVALPVTKSGFVQSTLPRGDLDIDFEYEEPNCTGRPARGFFRPPNPAELVDTTAFVESPLFVHNGIVYHLSEVVIRGTLRSGRSYWSENEARCEQFNGIFVEPSWCCFTEGRVPQYPRISDYQAYDTFELSTLGFSPPFRLEVQ